MTWILRLGALSTGTLVVALGACGGDDEADDGAGGSGGAPATTSTSSSGGTGAAGPVTSSQMSSSSTGMCTMGGEPGCPCPDDVCPTALVRGLDFASSLRQNTADLWYVASIERLPKAGGMPTKVVTELIAALTVDDAGIYWIDGTASFVKTAAHDGSGVQFIANGDGLMHPQFVAVDDTFAYWATVAAMGNGSCVRVHRAPKVGAGTAEQLAEICDPTVQRVPYGLTVDDTEIYWATVTSPALQDGKILSSAKAGGGTVAEIVLANGPIKNLSVHGTLLYFVAGGAVNVYDLAAGGMADKISGQVDVSAYAVDGSEIWIVGDEGLHSVDASTEMSTLLAYEHGSDIVVDATSIYWLSDVGDGTSILKLDH